METGSSGQALLIQLETALRQLVESYCEEPYRFHSKADVITELQSWVARRPGLGQLCRTTDGYETRLLHSEFPVAFRYSRNRPLSRLELPTPPECYDLALLDPAYVRDHSAETVINRREERDELAGPPLLAAVDFAVSPPSWRGRWHFGAHTWRQRTKLDLALQPPADVSTAYFCLFQRDPRREPVHRDQIVPFLQSALTEFPDVRTVIGASWPWQERERFVLYTGPWITVETD
jgi:hypothetical protein